VKAKVPNQTILNRGIPLARGIVGAWMMDEAVGDTILDSSGFQRHGTFDNGLTGASWVFNPIGENGGWGVDFDRQEYISGIQIGDALNGKHVSCYVTFTANSLGVYDRLLDRVYNGQFAFYLHTVANRLGTAISAVGGNYDGVIGLTTISTGVRYNALFIYDGSKIKTYIDGVFDSEVNAALGVLNNSSADARIGNSNTSTRGFDGVIEKVILWDRPLLQYEAQNIDPLVERLFYPRGGQ
jgi:hypothetical protein